MVDLSLFAKLALGFQGGLASFVGFLNVILHVHISPFGDFHWSN
jgi:hypothetical protein